MNLFIFKCSSDHCDEAASVHADNRPSALKLIKAAGWGGVLKLHCPVHQERMDRMFNLR